MPSFFRLACIAGSASTFCARGMQFFDDIARRLRWANTPNQHHAVGVLQPDLDRRRHVADRRRARPSSTARATWPSRISGSASRARNTGRSARRGYRRSLPGRRDRAHAWPRCRRQAEFLVADMHGAANADRTERVEPGLALASAMKSWMVSRPLLRHDHHVGAGSDHQHRREVAGGVEGRARKDRRRDRQRRRLGERL